ncbi:MAG: glycosyltransferase [Planctomycetota bacterium]|jgi:UDP-N-acetylglucosamine transferase subunit ALG13
MIFLTVGTQFAFDRLVKSVDCLALSGLIDERIYAQIGRGLYKPRNFDAVGTLKKNLFDRHLQTASCIISHAGMGTITMALELNKPLLVMPRRQAYGEVVNDHQVAIAKRFEQMGHILVAYNENDLPAKIAQLRYFKPQPRNNNPEAVIGRISDFLNRFNHAEK